MQNPEPVDVTLTEFSNQLIHSWVWPLSATEDARHGFDGVWVSSDWASKTCLYFISAETLIGLFRAVGLDDVVEVQYQRGSDGVMRVVKATRGSP